MLVTRCQQGGIALGFGFVPKGQERGEDKKIDFFFFFLVLIGPRNLKARRHPKRCLAFITRGERLKARQGGEQGDWSHFAARVPQQKRPGKHSLTPPARHLLCSWGNQGTGSLGFQSSNPKARAEGRLWARRAWQFRPRMLIFKRKSKFLQLQVK